MNHVKKDKNLKWRVDTPSLLAEICNNPGVAILKIPLNIFRIKLIELAECAIRINDPELNVIMLRLALYEEGNPNSKEYNPKAISQQEKLIKKKSKNA